MLSFAIREQLFFSFPLRSGRGTGRGLAPFTIVISPGAGVFVWRSPPQALDQLSLRGGAAFLGATAMPFLAQQPDSTLLGRQANAAKPLSTCSALLIKFPLPNGEGDRGRGHDSTLLPYRPRGWKHAQAITPSGPLGQLPLRGGADLFGFKHQWTEWGSMRKSGKTAFTRFPLPSGGPTIPPRWFSRCAVFEGKAASTSHPFRSFGPAPPGRGSESFFGFQTSGGAGTDAE